MNSIISVIVPCYNYGHYLCDSIGSVLNQKLIAPLQTEVIIVDDASTDQSFDLATEITRLFNNVHVIRNDKNSKVSFSRNVGIKQSTGQFLVCLDADDIIPSNYLQANYDTLIKNNVDISYSNSQCFGKSNKLYTWPEYDINNLRGFNFIHCAAMYNRKVWESVGGYDESFIYGVEDYDFWLMAAKNGFSFKKCNDTFLWYRRSDKQSADNTAFEHKEFISEQLKKKHGDFLCAKI